MDKAPLPGRHRILRPLFLATAFLTLSEQLVADKVAQPDTTIEANSPEMAKTLHRNATVDIRVDTGDHGKGGWPADMPSPTQDNLDFASSGPNCTATNIGDGWYVTANHCFGADIRVGSGSYDAIFDYAPMARFNYSAWHGKEGNGIGYMDKAGQADGIIIEGTGTRNDVAFLHLKGVEKGPGVKISPVPPNMNDQFFITGYPQADNFEQDQFPLRYLGNLMGSEFDDVFGLNSDQAIFYVFGIPAGTPNAAAACHPGMSGSSVIDAKGSLYGVLSRYDVPGGSMWNALHNHYDIMPDVSGL